MQQNINQVAARGRERCFDCMVHVEFCEPVLEFFNDNKYHHTLCYLCSVKYAQAKADYFRGLANQLINGKAKQWEAHTKSKRVPVASSVSPTRAGGHLNISRETLQGEGTLKRKSRS